ncbi:hypothetical protein HY383_01560 [Candidatus Daviesbacteria bacterium]|nr:hypothetical protein [Candidatus Daviesbacteria bacterium]
MPKIALKIIPSIILWGIIIFIILKVPYPENIAQANLTHLAILFISLYLAMAFTVNIFLKNIFSSLSISLGLSLLLILKALDSLNLITGTLVVIAVGLFLSYFKKAKKKNLTKLPKIPKLTSLQRRTK